MPSYMIRIVRDENGVVSFDPSPLTARKGDIVNWRNEDDQEAHWPALLDEAGNPDRQSLMRYQIPKRGDQTGVSDTGFAPQSDGAREYVCALHPSERGRIVVGPLVAE